MPLTIKDAYELPAPEDIRAMGFLIKLRELAAGSDELKRLVGDYVVTPAVAQDLPVVFEKIRQVFERGDAGRSPRAEPGVRRSDRGDARDAGDGLGRA